jgi:hypothetical protein
MCTRLVGEVGLGRSAQSTPPLLRSQECAEAVSLLGERFDSELRPLPEGAIQDVLGFKRVEAEGWLHEHGTRLGLVLAPLDRFDELPAEVLGAKQLGKHLEPGLGLESLELVHGCSPLSKLADSGTVAMHSGLCSDGEQVPANYAASAVRWG